jgi:hypothetical protein
MRVNQPLAIAIAVAAPLLWGCGDETAPDRPGGPQTKSIEGDEPITARAVAAVALEHLPTDTSSRSPETREGIVGAEFRYGADGEYDGDYLAVGVSESRGDADPCRNMDRCETEDVEGGELIVAWQALVPEVDPGVVVVAMRRPGEDVTAYYVGDNIEGDPRELDLTISVAEMEAVVQDQRISLTTSAEVIELGEQLEDFRE